METIRRAVVADAAAIRDVLVASFADAFDGVLDAEEIAAICEKTFSANGIEETVGRAGAIALVALTDGTVSGHGLASVDGDIMTLHRLYVRPRGRGRGLGGQLLAAICAAAGPVREHRLHVIRSNESAIAFYRRQGFAIVAEAEDDLGPVTVPVYEMVREAAAAIP